MGHQRPRIGAGNLAENRRHPGHTVCRKAGLSTPHWQVHISGEAFATLTNLPPLDVLYLDWLAWLEAHAPTRTDFANAIGALFTRSGKAVWSCFRPQAHGDERRPAWMVQPPQRSLRPLAGGSLLANKGVVEWMSPDLYGEYHTHMATVYEVHHGIDGDLAQKDWEQAMQAWTWTVMPEVSMSPDSVKALLDSEPSRRFTPTRGQVQWMDDWFRRRTNTRGPAFWDQRLRFPLGRQGLTNSTCNGCLTTRPLARWLSQTTYKLLGEAFNLHIVHGDLVRLAPALHAQDAVLAVRAPLAQKGGR